jgi:predicted nucleotide-binding protein
MIERFKHGDLIQALKRQTLVECNEEIARRIASQARHFAAKRGEIVIQQGSETSEIFFILDGSVDVLVNGRRVNVRHAGDHIGEMAVVMNSKRTATVIAREDCIFVTLERTTFLQMANEFPTVWRVLADELARRLDQRKNLIREPNERPHVFIASSKESSVVANCVRDGLVNTLGERVNVRVWSDRGVFQPSSTYIEDLERAAGTTDFAVIVFGKDDLVRSRWILGYAPRDNVVFEAGLFIGGIGRQRTLLMRPTGVRLKMPSDLEGIVLLSF